MVQYYVLLPKHQKEIGQIGYLLECLRGPSQRILRVSLQSQPFNWSLFDHLSQVNFSFKNRAKVSNLTTGHTP